MRAREDLLAIPDEVLRRGKIAQACLVHMDFRDNPKWWWTGRGDLDHAGQRWQGVGDLISVSPIDTNYGISARQVTFSLAATKAMLAAALAAKAQVRDRAVTVYLQLFATVDAPTPALADYVAGVPIGSPISMFAGTMQRMPWSIKGLLSRKVSVEAEGLFFRRNAAPRGRWTDADQKARHSGDRGFERVALVATGYETTWRR